MRSDDFRIRPATRADLHHLARIEKEAASRFREAGLRGDCLEETTPPSVLAAACDEGRLWVAADATGTVAGFALGAVLDDGTPLLEEVDVLPSFGRRGLGAALVAAAADWARERGASTLVLRTFADLPWNAPMYARLGFVVVAEDASTDAERALRDEEARRGLPVETRVTMRLELRANAGARASADGQPMPSHAGASEASRGKAASTAAGHQPSSRR